MEPNSIETQSANSKLIPAIVAGVVIAALVAGGGVYAYEKNQNDTAQASLQSQIDSLNSRLAASPTPASTIPTPSATPLATTTPSATSPALTTTPVTVYKTLTWNPTGGNAKGNTDVHLSVRYPSDCSTVAFAPADITQRASSPTPSEVDCQRDGGKLSLVFTNPYTVADTANHPYLMDGTAYDDYGRAHATVHSTSTLTTPNGIYNRILLSSDTDPTKWQLDYFFKNDVTPVLNNNTEMEVTGHVPASVSASQLKVLDDMMQTLSCSGTGCHK